MTIAPSAVAENVAAEMLADFETRRERPAVVDPRGRVTTYGELIDEVARGRSRIARAGLTPGSKVILQTPNGAPFVTATLALAVEGHTTVGIEMAQGPEVYADRARFLLADAVISTGKVRLLQRSDRVRRRLGSMGIELPPPLALPTIDWDAPAEPRSSPNCDTDEEHIALIVFTGGTTARPKGVQLSHRAVRFYLAGLGRLPEWPGVSTLLADHPQQVLYGLAHGKAVHLSPARPARRPEHIARQLFQEGIDCYFGSPVMWDAILNCGLHHAPSSWPRAVLLGGAPVTQPLLERLERELDPSVSIRCLYGMSEAGLVAHLSAREKLELLRRADRPAGNGGDPVGRPVDGVTVEVACDGELLVGSPSRFSGYVGEPLAALDAPFPTGDAGRLDADGLWLSGRTKNMIVQRGVNLYAEQFEARLLQRGDRTARTFDDVALVAGPSDQLGDEHFVLVFVSASTGEASALEACAAVFPGGHAPSRAVRVAALPRSGRQNKVDRSALGRLVAARSLEAVQTDLFDRLVAELAPRSRNHVRAIAMRTLARRNLAKVQLLDRASSVDADPVFVLGHQRSGTTFLHHALASALTATAMTLTDMLVPHPGGWRVARRLAPIARRLHSRALASSRWGAALARHDLDPSAPEEEEWLFAALGLSGFVPSAFGPTLGSDRFEDLRDRAAWGPETRRALLDVYASIVGEWHRHRNDPVPYRHIAKNPAFGPLAGDLLRSFPSARFVVALRDPHDAVCSRIALISAIHDRPLTANETAVVVRDSVRQLSGLAEQVQLLPADRVHLVSFDRLQCDPKSVVEQACRFAALDTPKRLPPLRRSAPASAPPDVPERDALAASIPEFVRLFERGEARS